MSFMNSVKETLNEEFNYATTENGALVYRTSGKNLLDINFAVSSLRSANESDIIDRFMKAYYDDKILALKWLFYARDIRGGLGERRLFRTIFNYLASNNPETVKGLVEIIPEYGRYDDLLGLLDGKQKTTALKAIAKQLKDDLKNMKANKPISLLAKWLPSVSSSKRELAGRIATYLGYTEKEYRKTLSKMRTYLDIVEKKMSQGEWNGIKYEAVPSRANLIYNSAFLKHDEERRREFLGKLEKGETKINAATLFPHDIVHRYSKARGQDAALEGMWKALPDIVKGNDNTIVVADGSGSMSINKIPKTDIELLSVANALAIYFAERSSGQFKDQYITFSMKPQIVNLSNGKNLKEKLEIARRYNEVANTNIEAVFDLILKTAINKKMEQSELPKNILIISDMEFDSCAGTNGGSYDHPNQRLFEVFAKRYADVGYQLPRLVFWNVNSRTGTIPVKENALGVALVSGYSPSIVKMVMSNQTDPFLCLVEALNVERYQPIEDIVRTALDKDNPVKAF